MKNLFKIRNRPVTFQVLKAESMKMNIFWDVPCSLVEIDRRFRDAYCLHYQVDRSKHL
jgi:hypothetical protein